MGGWDENLTCISRGIVPCSFNDNFGFFSAVADSSVGAEAADGEGAPIGI
jgi:hypothetical protein